MLRKKRLRPSAIARLISAGLLAWLAGLSPARAAPDISRDFTSIMGWLSQEMAHGLAFNAGSIFDPPTEIQGLALASDASIGVGVMPLDKTKFPVLETQDLNDVGVSNIYPSHAMFPNMTLHLRAGLPRQSDISFRFTDMTTPPGYKISPTATGKGQSNSIGFGLRKHFSGDGGLPNLAVGANFNHVFGRFQYFTEFALDKERFFVDNDVTGTMQWNINSLGVNAVISRNFGGWIPFAGVGYNYATGSVRSRLNVIARTDGIPPIMGESSSHPEPNQGRVILGAQLDYSWMHFFVNGEIKAIGVNAGRSWIVHGGLMLPFRIGSSSRNRQAAAAKFPKHKPDEYSLPELIFIQ